jgi:hypothetical protein
MADEGRDGSGEPVTSVQQTTKTSIDEMAYHLVFKDF